MFHKNDIGGYKQMLEGIKIKTLVFGKKTLLTEFRLEKESKIPRHSHPHEQTGYLVSGRMLLFIGEETFETEAGDSWSLPGDVEHSAEIIEDSIAVEVFSPVREDYLPDNL